MAEPSRAIDEYIAGRPPDIRNILDGVRAAFHRAEPALEEAFSYKMPAFLLDGRYLLYFGAWKHHVGIYPVGPFGDAFDERIDPYRSTKDTLRFLYAKPVPFDLIEAIVGRVVERARSNA